MKNYRQVLLALLLIAIAVVMLSFVGCASTNKTDELVIKNFSMLVIGDQGTDNIEPVDGAALDADMNLPISGVPVPITLNYKSGGILAKSTIHIEGATGAVIIINRAISGNSGVPVKDALSKVFKPTEHPFGNITVQGGDAMVEHVEEGQ